MHKNNIIFLLSLSLLQISHTAEKSSDPYNYTHKRDEYDRPYKKFLEKID